MTMHAQARPAGPDAPWNRRLQVVPELRDDALPHDTAVILYELRTNDARCRGLSRGAWSLLQALIVYIRKHKEAWPSQFTLGEFTGYSDRAIRDFTDELEAAGLITTRRERWRDGGERIFYGYGSAALRSFRDLAARLPRAPAKTAPPKEAPASASAKPTSSHPPEKISEALPASFAEKHEAFLKEPSSCQDSSNPPAPRSVDPVPPSSEAASPPEEEVFWKVTSEDRAVAKEALKLRAERQNPKRPAPTWWDKPLVELVAVRVAQTSGSLEEKLEVQRFAVAGAWIASREQAPTVRFIWGEQEHFLEHVERGRKRARNDAWRARREAESQGGGQSPPSPALLSSASVETPSQGLGGDILAETSPPASSPLPNPNPAPRARGGAEMLPYSPAPERTFAEDQRIKREDTLARARDEARLLAQRRADAQRAAIALAASWGEDVTGVATTTPVDAEQLRAARREVEAELAELRRARENPPPT